MKNQKGITLVALIITIIVMLILAGVIISAAVADGGVIDRAQSAIQEKERAEVEEIVKTSYVYKTTASTTMIGKLDLPKTAKAIYENLTANGYEVTNAIEVEENGTKYKTLEVKNDEKIELSIEGNHGNYTGTVEKGGLRDSIVAVEEINKPEGNEPEPISIAGKYGYDNRPNEDSYEYYIFNENTSTGQYVKDRYYGTSNFSYIMDENGNGTITFEDGETQTFAFEGTVNNKVIYIINLWGDNTNVAYTTNWADGLDKINNGTYEVHEDDEYKGEAIFNNNMLRIEYTNGWIDEDTDNYFVKDNYLYMLMSDEDEPNYYFTCYKIEGNKLISLMS